MDWNLRGSWGRTPLYLAIEMEHRDIVDLIVQQPNIDYNVKTTLGRGETVAHIAVTRGHARFVETLAALERCDCWNVPDHRGDTPIMWAFKAAETEALKTEILEILLRCPRVDLSCRDKGGWSLVFRAIQRNQLGEKMS